jgi:hypothetical protein
MKNRARLIATIALALPLVAQEPLPRFQAFHLAGGAEGLQGQIADVVRRNTFEFIGAEMSFEGRVVKGAPYSAEAVTETTQALANGNRIHRQSSSLLYRDSEGRTRREQAIGPIGPYANSGEALRLIHIYDPAASVTYVLDPKTHTARKMEVFAHETKLAPDAAAKAGRRNFSYSTSSTNGGATVFVTNSFEMAERDAKNETLGKSMVEGVQAEGTRHTVTIPAGQIGNDLPIDMVTESWYSSELQMVVMTKSSDPRFGETVYRLTNINRSEPARNLFEVPSDYTIQENPDVRVMKKMKKDEM